MVSTVFDFYDLLCTRRHEVCLNSTSVSLCQGGSTLLVLYDLPSWNQSLSVSLQVAKTNQAGAHFVGACPAVIVVQTGQHA